MTSYSQPVVSVVIPHYNDLCNLRCCLESLRNQSLSSHRFEIIVADNNSVGGVAAVEQVASSVIVVSAAEQGAGPARNAGAAIARGGHLAFIDSDCTADENWLRDGVAALEQYDYVGGRVVTTIADMRSVTPAEAFEAVFAFNFKKYIEADKFAGSGNLFVRREVFEQVGGFRAGVSEDVDWCRRANSMGFRLGYAAEAIVYHGCRREWADLKRRWDRMMSEDIRSAMELPGWQLRWLAHASKVAVSPLVHWLAVLRSPRLVGPRAKGLALLGLVRIRVYRSYRMMCLLFWPPT